MTISEEHNEKVIQSIRLANNLKTIFRKMAKDMKLNYSRFGTMINTSAYNQEIRYVVKQRSRIVANKFKNFDRSNTKDLSQNIDEDINQLIEETTEENTLFIFVTNAKQQQEILNKVLEKMQKNNEIINNETVADRLSSEYLQDGFNRSGTIGDVVVNQSAEGAKAIEINNLIALGLLVDPSFKWDTIMDGNERPCHRRANGQIVKIGEPFQVCGELLMYPTDTSLGATAKNVIRCRCSKRRVL